MNQAAKDIWANAQEKLKERLGPQTFDTWLKPVTALSIGEDAITLRVPNQFSSEWLGQHYMTAISEALLQAASHPLKVVLVAPSHEGSTLPPPERRPQPQETVLSSSQTAPVDECGLRERYKFENFVIGKSNEFAYATAYATAQAPGRLYNPLFIYGGVGLGKTHLMQAIGHFVKFKRTKVRIYYTPAENFMNEMVHAIQNRRTLEFKNKYRTLDVLLLDDVQFLTEKSGIQEEIFHTFNSLYDARKQIVLTSDRPPKDISHLEERLVSRFQCGLVADIQPPDLETRAAILKKKAAQEGFSVPNEVIYFIAESVKSNIRDLEGSLIRVAAFSSVADRELTVDLAKEVLKNLISGNGKRPVSIESIQKAVAGFFSLPEETLRSKKRTKELVVPRQMAMYLCRELTGASLNDIGSRFGGKDHTTVLHAIAKVKQTALRDQEFSGKLERITRLVKGE
jgi:chromosomal replication initiator protein